MQESGRPGLLGRYWRLVSRYAAASAVATVVSQLVFLASYSLGAPPPLATMLAWLCGAIPNFLLNRRTWGGGDAVRGELARFAIVSVGTAVLAALVTTGVEQLAVTWFANSRPTQVALVQAAFLGTYVAMFVVKFFLIDRFVFTAHRKDVSTEA
ncbi:GtrA family protein [Allosaccharopolyspora coralli]|uniref:GtrA family protein n=1 Tax=Allosaccharopolyspora coralli TaxID=2665642 RepID=UPI001E57C7C8|nr:GtrA family protein [Allosaccharopolyspora coralli]